MKTGKHIHPLLFILAITLGPATASAGDHALHSLTPTDEKNHQQHLKSLSAEQIKVVSGIYPGFRIVSVCPGNFSGSGRNEAVLGVWKPIRTKYWWKREIHRVGLIWNGSRWQAHDIDRELEKDGDISHSYPMIWQFTFDKNGFAGEMKCGIESEFSGSSDLTRALGDKPFFDLKETGVSNPKVACFATDDVYNNWDCVVYSPKDGRFRLWYQQAHAD